MKILIVGLFEFSFYEEEFGQALSELGHEIHYYKVKTLRNNFIGKIEYNLTITGPITIFENNKIIKKVKSINPEIVLFWRGTFILKSTLKLLKDILPNTILTSYNNDDPFSNLYKQGTRHQKYLWNRFINAIPFYDINYVYRPYNILDYDKKGSLSTKLLLPGFNRKNVEDLIISEEFDHEVVFIGHQEPHRLEVINYLIENNIDVKIFGNWNLNVVSKKYKYSEISPIYGKSYFSTINRSKVTLCFFSKLNRDTYTRRTFEIPAAYGVMCSERTESMLQMFEDYQEAVYFDKKEECLFLVNKILSDLDLRTKIAFQGNLKVYSLNAEITKRALHWVESIHS